jgi:hypothetical protein
MNFLVSQSPQTGGLVDDSVVLVDNGNTSEPDGTA